MGKVVNEAQDKLRLACSVKRKSWWKETDTAFVEQCGYVLQCLEALADRGPSEHALWCGSEESKRASEQFNVQRVRLQQALEGKIVPSKLRMETAVGDL